jgi:DNA invertase Pin-like site-specific DNA recombinase
MVTESGNGLDPKSMKIARKRNENSKGQMVGYVRVSSLDQKTDRQLEGIDCDKTFTDKLSGKDLKRPQLDAMLAFVREGDTVVVHSMDRLARTLDDLRKIVLGLTARKVQVRFVKESMTYTGTDSPVATLSMNMMGAFAEFERAIIRERQREGIALAKKAGVYTGRKPALSAAQAAELRARFDAGESRAQLANDFSISKETVYQYAGKRSSATPRAGYKEKEVYGGGRVALLNAKQVAEMRRRVGAGESKATVGADFKVSRMTVHRYLTGEVKPRGAVPNTNR